MRTFRLLACLAFILLLTACADTRYYLQSVRGHLTMLQAARPIEAWTQGKDFDHICKLTNEDEGSLVRYIRMVIQLLREIANAPHASETLKAKARHARELIDRDVVDAEKQLRV